MSTARKERIRRHLDLLVLNSVITDYDIQVNMPGLRWVLYGLPFYGTGRAYSTKEMEAFLEGIEAQLDKGVWQS